MASLKITLITLAFLGIAMSTTLAKDYVVGDAHGWDVGPNYQSWANGKRFKVGDRLIFKYSGGFHNVVQVNQHNFQACVAPKDAKVLDTGNDIVELKTRGTFSFICDVASHCASGNQKVSINVLA